MHLLAMDTSGPVCSVAVVRENQIVSEHMTVNQKTHSVNLIPMIDRAMEEAGLRMQDLDRLACTVGPGSFTGVRIGVSTAKGLAHGAGIPCVAVDALEAMAVGLRLAQGLICPIQDARAGQVYAALFRAEDGKLLRVMDDQPIALKELMIKLLAGDEAVTFVGDAVPVHGNQIVQTMGAMGRLAPAHLSYLRAASVAVLGMESKNLLTYTELQPLYLRAPSAERNRKLVEAAQRG